MRPLLVISACALLPACFADESVASYGASDKTWHLQEIDGQPFTSEATLTFPEPGRVSGRGPCNNFTADMDAPYPWFDVGPIAATRAACPDLDAEQLFFGALDAMSIAEVSGNIMVLSTDTGREMVFSTSG